MNAAAQDVPSFRFVDNGDDTITDPVTGLMWSKATLSKKCVTQKTAEKTCNELELAGHKDWRLPTIAELFTLVDHTRHGPAIDTSAFPDTKSDWYWSSTLCAWSSGHAWIVSFSDGFVGSVSRGYNHGFVRAVRAASPRQ